MVRRGKNGTGPNKPVPGTVGGDRWSADPDRGLRGYSPGGGILGAILGLLSFLAFFVGWLLLVGVVMVLPLVLLVLLLNLVT